MYPRTHSYNAPKIEKKWQKRWNDEKIYQTDLHSAKKPKYYNLVMFPYPSSDKLHVGHWYNFGPADTCGRFMRMKGYNVLEPMGYDAFGLPAENYAIKHGVPPALTTEKNIAYMRTQLQAIGAMYDWSKEINTSRPDYYKWTQWVFLKLYERGLAYRGKAPVNWCPSCQTVLANEQVENGVCERCKTQVIQKELTQWFFRITDYVEELLDFSQLDWPEKTNAMQRHWIGRSEGINITYDIEGLKKKITVFTTRPDTNFGATFIVMAPDSRFVKEHLDLFPQKKEIQKYVLQTAKKTELERLSEGRKKTGVFSGLYAINNLNQRKMPIYVSDFVMATVGTGIVVGVPGHDLRDFEFAKTMKLPIIRVVVGKDGDTSEITRPEQVQEERGTMINSDFLDGLDIHLATQKITDYLEKKKWGKGVVNYRLRDWLLSRQRYWGAPIPIIYCEKCGEQPLPFNKLPVLLPENVDFKPKGDGKSPLAHNAKFVQTSCPKCGEKAERETDTMDTFVCSSWYYLRYLSAHDEKQPFDQKIAEKWLPVDMYIGGSEHACMHLLYARFIHKVLRDAGYFKHNEPFKRLVHQGTITKDGAKMSKSRGNVVSPDKFVAKYGSDVFRMYLMFMGPFTMGGDWSDRGITGVARFVERLYQFILSAKKPANPEKLKVLLHKTIKKVTAAIGKMHFNIAIAALMEFYNQASKIGLDQNSQKILLQLVAPLAPHLAEELWEKIGGKFSIFDTAWPEFNADLTKENTLNLPIQINGKLRGTVEITIDLGQKEAVKKALSVENVRRHIEDKEIIKEIYIPGKILNLIVK